MQGAWVTEKLIRPRPVTAELFSGRIEGIDVSTAGAICKALKKAELLNATDFLKEDPRWAPNALITYLLRRWCALCMEERGPNCWQACGSKRCA